MKYKLKTYFYNTTTKDWFWQIVLIPSLWITHNKYVDCWVFSISFLVWDFGIKIEQNYE